MTVWILIKESGNSCEMDGYAIIGVFKSEAALLAYRAEMPKKEIWESWQIEEHEVK